MVDLCSSFFLFRYKCVVRGMRLRPDMPWLYDLQRSVGCTLSRTLQVHLAGAGAEGGEGGDPGGGGKGGVATGATVNVLGVASGDPDAAAAAGAAESSGEGGGMSVGGLGSAAASVGPWMQTPLFAVVPDHSLGS